MCRDARSGPDWTDVRVYARTLEQTHECAFTLAMQPVFGDGSQLWRVVVMLTSARPGRSLAGTSVCAESDWPTAKYKDLAALVLRLCYDADYAAAKEFWRQSELA